MERNRMQGDIGIETGDGAPGRGHARTAFLKEHWNAIWRLFFIQSSRNEKTMDGLGFYAVISPFVKKWGGPANDAKEIARRHLDYFNGGLYLSSAVAGVVANMERRRSSGEPVAPERIDRTKTALSSVLAARANHFFDGLLIPFGLTIACTSAIYGSYVGLAAFLAGYNIYHFQYRIGGYCSGTELGEGMGGAFVARLFREERLVAGCAAFASGVFAALLFVRSRGAGGGGFLVWGAIVLAASAILGKRTSPVRNVGVLLLATALYLVVYGGAFARLW
ncbi:MAG: PTS system mannose/fructose/sorbose family transporter subunit IID [Candidatus Krumholzibacteria bacterium]|nr:PTS system mannose/fructose/sorbose family transporter subunit IID [Candidatus Krumholzibacteria bacterium]